jgi:hypothetical protein
MITSPEEFARLRLSELPEEQSRAGSEEASIEVWLGVLEEFPDLRQWVAQNKTVPIDILARLSTDPSTQVRCTVAGKRKLTHELRSHLARDIDASVRARVAYNAKCEIDVLQMLVSDQEAFVREAALSNLSKRQRPNPSFQGTPGDKAAGRP